MKYIDKYKSMGILSGKMLLVLIYINYQITCLS